MDLRSIINNEGGESSASQNKAQHPPATPGQPGPSPNSNLYREYNHESYQSQPPLSRQTSQEYDYGAQTPQFTSPTAAYQVSFQGRPPAPPPPPPLQPQSSNDIRSPAASSHYSAQSPFRHTSSSSASAGPYPFPQNAVSQSPVQVQQYPKALQHRESYPQNDYPQPPPSQHLSYPQPSQVPLTPPIGTANNSYPLLQQQRSQSSQSTSTPTSAQSQSNFYPQPLQDSPIANSAYPSTPFAPDQRQRSQPGTPLGPPISTQRQGTGSYPIPTSPYQQRPQSLGVVNQEQLRNEHISPPPSLSTAPTTPGTYSSHHPLMPETKRISQVDREQSLSVSPKTTISGLPRSGSLNQLPQLTTEPDPTPASTKRKMDDRQSSESRRYSGLSNGDSASSNQFTSPQQPRKRRRYNEPPIWAQSWLRSSKNKQPVSASTSQINGSPAAKPPAPPPPAQAIKPEPVGPQGVAVTRYDDILGPWEPSISDTTPVNDITKVIADFLFLEVVNRNDWGELQSRGVQVEIEAKLGQLIDKDTNQRYWLPVASECVLAPTSRVSFRSSMTEEQHKKMNGFLNDMVTQAHPSNLNRPKPRVPIQYAHRRERDSFYELPPPMVLTLPAAVQHLIKQSKRHSVKVRVSHDQKTGQVLAKIIKTRVQDLDIYIPSSPLDCRISVNLEMKYDGDIEALGRGVGQPDRLKDRLSYTHSNYQIDLTQVTSTAGEKEHELEIEIDTKALVEQGLRLKSNQPHRYDALVEGLINNIHVLTKELTLFEQRPGA